MARIMAWLSKKDTRGSLLNFAVTDGSHIIVYVDVVSVAYHQGPGTGM